MSTVATVPVTITPEAAEYVAELGMQVQLQQMLEHAQRTVPGLRELRVELHPPYDLGPNPGVLIRFHYPDTGSIFLDVWEKLSSWKITEFPPEVCIHFTFMPAFEEPNER